MSMPRDDGTRDAPKDRLTDARLSMRELGQDDLDSIVSVFLDCWRVSYAAVLPAAVIERMTSEDAYALWTSSLRRAGLILTGAFGPGESDRVLGFVGYSVEQDEGYVASLYVSPRAVGRGVGRVLLSTAERDIALRGAPTARLWVFSRNVPSIRFYERNGWAFTGTSTTLPEWGEPQSEMRKPLSADEPR